MKNSRVFYLFLIFIGFIFVSGNISAQAKAELSVSIRCPGSATAGDFLKKSVKVFVSNKGKAAAYNFALDLVLSKNKNIPYKFAGYSPKFKDDVLLKGGREFIKKILPGQTIQVNLVGGNQIPTDTPTGLYFLGAVVDPGNKVSEYRKQNNIAYCRMKIRGKLTPVITTIPKRMIRKVDIDISNIYVDNKCRLWITHRNNGHKRLDIVLRERVWVNGKLIDDSRETLQINPGQSFNHGVLANPGYIVKGTVKVKAQIDVDNVLTESNEFNNTLTKVIRCKTLSTQLSTPASSLQLKKPDLGMYGFLKIGKKKKEVKWGRTIVLTPSDATLISNGKPAFDLFYAHREYNHVKSGEFKNKVFFKGKVVSIQTKLQLNSFQIQNIHTQAYIGPENGKLYFNIDADNEVAESREDNNFNFFVNVIFRGFNKKEGSNQTEVNNQKKYRFDIQGIKRIMVRPDKIKFQVQYYISPNYPKACFIGASLPGKQYAYKPAGKLPRGVPKGQKHFRDNIVVELMYRGQDRYIAQSFDVSIYDKDKRKLDTTTIRWAHDWSYIDFQGIKRIVTQPHRVKFQVQYYISPDYPKACFLGGSIPNHGAASSKFSMKPAGRLPNGVPKGQRHFTHNITFEIDYIGTGNYTSRTIELYIYDKDKKFLDKDMINWGQVWQPPTVY